MACFRGPTNVTFPKKGFNRINTFRDISSDLHPLEYSGKIKPIKKERVDENCDVFGFCLKEEDIETINQLHDGRHVSQNMPSEKNGTCPMVKLSNGVQVPVLGIGTSQVGGFSQDTVLYAVRDCGIRLIDTSKYNGFETQLAEVIRESGVPRTDLWLVNKLWPEDYGYESAKRAFRESCSRMGVEYLDIYMLHWPGSIPPGQCNRKLRAESWRALEELYEAGHCRSIGVSNFMIHHLEQLKEDCTVVPHINQVEYHPFQQPRALIQYCRQEGIVFQGYCPLAKGQALSNPKIMELAQKYGRTPAQICIRWSIQTGALTIPKSIKKERVDENCDVFGFCLKEEDMEAINKLHDGRHVSWDPTNVE